MRVANAAGAAVLGIVFCGWLASTNARAYERAGADDELAPGEPSLVTLECSGEACPGIRTTLYGVDPGGTIETFDFRTGEVTRVHAPGDFPVGGPEGLAVAAPDRAFWISSFGLDLIFEFDPITGDTVDGVFPIAPAGSERATDGLAIVDRTRLFSLNFTDDEIYESDMTTGLPLGSLAVAEDLLGGLAGGVGRLFAVIDGTSIGEIDTVTGEVTNTFAAPDLSGNGNPDVIAGLAFDGRMLFVASTSAAPPNVAAIDPDTGALLAVSPYTAPSEFLTALDTVATVCGDENVELGEDCDDGNAVDGDGCDSDCTLTGCGNGIVTPPEKCDRFGESETCDDDCTLPECGDGNANEAFGEACDDGESLASGCAADCTLEICYRCEGTTSVCVPDQGARCFVGGDTCDIGECGADAECVAVTVLPDGSACDDGSRCTLGDVCEAGNCASGQARDCRGLDSDCTTGSCDEATGECIAGAQRPSEPCDDGKYCTVGEQCRDGKCVGQPRDCSFLDSVCSFGRCDEGSETCAARIVLDCSDENDCTDDACNPTLGCVSAARTGECDDADFCTVDDVCVESECSGLPRDCADDNECTFDMCDPASGCGHVPILADCDDANRCTESDGCDQGECRGTAIEGCKRVCGDVTTDGAVTAADALATLRIIAAQGDCDPAECDMDANGRVTATDALAILRVVVGLLGSGNCPDGSGTTGRGPEIEPNDTLVQATPVECPFETVGAAAEPAGDVDFFSFEAEEGDVVRVDIDAEALGSGLDSLLGIFDGERDLLVFSDDDAAPGEPDSLDSFVEFTAPADGTYYIGVVACCDLDFEGGTGTGAYTMSCAAVDSQPTSTLPATSTTAAVPGSTTTLPATTTTAAVSGSTTTLAAEGD